MIIFHVIVYIKKYYIYISLDQDKDKILYDEKIPNSNIKVEV